LDGQIGSEWFWDVNGIWGHNKAKQVMHGNINAANVAQALGPVSGCVGHTSNYNGQGTCVPLDLFGTPGSITQSMLDFIGFDQHDSSDPKLWGTSANISGKWFDVGGGALGLAGGVEYRRQKGRFDPDQVVQDG